MEPAKDIVAMINHDHAKMKVRGRGTAVVRLRARGGQAPPPA